MPFAGFKGLGCRGPCVQIVHTLVLKYLYGDYCKEENENTYKVRG